MKARERRAETQDDGDEEACAVRARHLMLTPVYVSFNVPMHAKVVVHPDEQGHAISLQRTGASSGNKSLERSTLSRFKAAIINIICSWCTR